MVTIKGSADKQFLPLFSSRQILAWCVLLLTMIMVLLTPSAFYILLLFPLMAIFIAFPVTKQVSRLNSLIFGSWIVVMFILAFAKWQLAEQLSSMSIVMITFIAAMSTILILLFHWHKRQSEALQQNNSSSESSLLMSDEYRTKIDSRVAGQMNLLTELEERTQHLTLLNQIGQVLSDNPTLSEAQTRISKLVTLLFDDAAGALCVRSRDSHSIRTITTWGDISVEAQFLDHECCALDRGKPHLFSKANMDEAFCDHLHDTGMSEYLCIPLKVPGQTLGVLHLHALPNETLSVATKKRAEIAAEQIALVLANLKLRQNLRLNAIRDPLTRLYNREYMEESLDQKLREMGKKKSSMGIIMLAVDQLQEFATTFGSEECNELLRELSTFVQSVIRSKDLACRYSDDHFVLMLPGASLDVTKQRAEQLCRGIEQLKAQRKCESADMITHSLGVVSYPQHGEDKTSLIHVAKEALDEAQATGVSRVIVG